MASDLALSGSLGYGIGLQAKVPDKTNLVFQLENLKLKRQALANQAKEQEEQKAAKQEAMFQKAINVDTTKWHRTLVGKVNQAANEAINEYSRLYAENPRVAQNSINQIMRKFNENVSQLNTANEQRKQFHKFLNDKFSKNEQFIGDEDEAFNYLNTGDDASLTQPFQTSLGEYTFNPNSTISISDIGNSGANKNAQQAADSGNYGKQEYRITPLGVEQYRGYDDNEVKRYMNDFYAANANAKIGDIAINKPKLKAAFDASGLAQTGMTFREFTDLSPKANPIAAQIVDNVLLDYHKGLLNTYSPKAQQVKIDPSDELKNLASSLTLPKKDIVTGEFIQTIEEISDKDIQDTWNAYKKSNFGQIVIALAGGEKNAKTIYENSIRAKREGLRKMMDFEGRGGFEVGQYKLVENPPVEKRILTAAAQKRLESLKENLKRNDIIFEDTKGNYVDKKTGDVLPDTYFINMLEEQFAKQGIKSPLYVETEGTSVLAFPADSRGAKAFSTTKRWSTGLSGDLSYQEGIFSHLIKDNATNKVIGVAIRPKIKEGEYGATMVVPYDDVNKGLFGAGKEVAPVQQKTGSMMKKAKESTYTIKGKKYTLSELKGMGYSEQQVEQYRNK